MRQTIIVSAVTAVVTVALSVAVLNQLEPGTVSSADRDGLPAGLVGPATETDHLIQGDVDCDGDVDAVDALKDLQHVAALGFAQTEPCPDIGTVIPVGDGVPGPQGPAGPQGEPGPQGPPGESGLSGFSSGTLQESFNSEGFKSTDAFCGADKVAFTGGVDVVGETIEVALIASHPLMGEGGFPIGWSAAAEEIDATSADWGIRVWVACANVAE